MPKRILAFVIAFVLCAHSQLAFAEESIKPAEGAMTEIVPEGEDQTEVEYPTRGLYEISSLLGDYCLDIISGSTADSANLQLYQRNDTNAQKFFLVPVKDEVGLYEIVNAKSGKAIDIYANKSENGTNVQQYTRNNTAAQRFRLIPNTDGISFRIQGVGSGLYLTVDGAEAKNGANVCIYEELTSASVKPEEFADDRLGGDEKETETEKEALEEGKKREETEETEEVEEAEETKKVEGTEKKEEVEVEELELKQGETEETEKTSISDATGSEEITLAIANDEEGTDADDDNAMPHAEQCWLIQETTYRMPSAGMYEVVSAIDQDYCMEVKGAALSNNVNVQLYQRNGTNAQKFYMNYVGEDTVVLTNVYSGKAIDVYGNGTADKTNVMQYEKNGTVAQIFRLVPSEDGGFFFIGEGSGKLLDAAGRVAKNGTNIWIYSQNGTAAQRWYLKSTSYKYPSVAKGKAVASTPVTNYITIVPKGNTTLTVQPSKESSASGITLGNAGNGTKDKWTMRELGGGKYEFINVSTGLALDNKNSSMADFNPMQLWKINGSTSQSWTPVDTGDGDGSFYLICSRSGKYLDIKSGKLSTGATVQQYQGNGTIAQKFYLRRVSKVADGKHNVGGKQMEFKSNKYSPVKTVRELYPQACAVLDQVGWDLYKAFLWSAGGGLRYRHSSTDASKGTRYHANYGFTNKVGNCYVMAATFTEMAKALGYDAQQISGQVGAAGGGFVPHSWVEVKKSGVTYVCDPDLRYETGSAGYMVSYIGGWNYRKVMVMT